MSTAVEEKMTQQLMPGDLVIARFGSPQKVACALGGVIDKPPTYNGIHSWRGGLVPSKYQSALLKAARLYKVRLTYKEIIEGGAP